MSDNAIYPAPQIEDLAHRMRRLRFFSGHFSSNIRMLANDFGLAVEIDGVKLTKAFLAWGEDFTRNRSAASIDRRDFMVFSAGTLLVHLIAEAPITVQQPDEAADKPDPHTALHKQAPSPNADPEAMADIVEFWPEGFLYTNYCISVLQTVIAQETQQSLPLADVALDLRNWWSFRENVREDRWNAIGFFDLFVGNKPNWITPAIASARPAMRRTATPQTQERKLE